MFGTFGRERQELSTALYLNGLPWIPMNPSVFLATCNRCGKEHQMKFDEGVRRKRAALNLHGVPWNPMDASASQAMCDSCREQQMKFHDEILQSWRAAVNFAPGGDLSLKKMTQLCILKNKEFFVRLYNQQPKINPFLRISNAMKKELIELDEAEMQTTENCGEGILKCQVLQLMLNQTITTFSFPPGLKSGESEPAVTELWQSLLAEKPPDLHTIVSRFAFIDGSWEKRSFFTSLLPVFPNLEVLRLEQFECYDADLITIAEHLPKLRVLEVKMSDKVSRRGICALIQLRSLQEFYFDNWRERTLLEHQIGMCFEYLPHLHAVAFQEPHCSAHHELSIQMKNALWKVRSTCTLKLRQLTMPDSDFINPEHVSLPELQVLHVGMWLGSEYEREIRATFFAFPNLTKLIMREVCYDSLMFALRHFGHQLQTLRYIIQDIAESEIINVLGECPNLSELDFRAIAAQTLMNHISRYEVEENVQYPSMRSLTMNFFHVSFMPAGSLVNLLRVMPELRHFQLKDVKLRVKDLEEVAELAKEGKLQHLQHITLDFCHTDIDDKCSINEAIVNWITHCPQLKQFQLSVTCLNNKRSDYNYWFHDDDYYYEFE